MSRQLSNKEKQFILKRDNYCCRYCGEFSRPFEFDHVYPYSKGGETSLDNIVTACTPCNRKKHSQIGIWPKPIGHFNKPRPTFISFVFALMSIFLLFFGVMIYSNNVSWSFWTILAGTVFGFLCTHTKRWY